MEKTQLTVCAICHLAYHGYESHELGRTSEFQPWGLVSPFIASDASDGESHFSNSPCDACGSDLAGYRCNYILFI